LGGILKICVYYTQWRKHEPLQRLRN